VPISFPWTSANEQGGGHQHEDRGIALLAMNLHPEPIFDEASNHGEQLVGEPVRPVLWRALRSRNHVEAI
jgi:hypothetical protein